jgi:hypothetical protein
MSRSSRYSGRIDLYSLSNEFITSKSYDTKKTRNEIIDMWKRNYPNRSFYVIIKPNLQNKKECQIN